MNKKSCSKESERNKKRNVTPVITHNQFDDLYDIYERAMKINAHSPAHSVDTSFYALYNGVLVEFWSREDGVVPSGYPLYDEVHSGLVQVVRDCQNVPALKLKINDLIKEYSTYALPDRLTKNKLFSQEASDILRDFIYYYRANSGEDDLSAFLSGKIDEFGNIYSYRLDSKPSAEIPGELKESIRLRLPYLPQVAHPKHLLLFTPKDVETMYNSTGPDILLIMRAAEKIIQDNPARKDKFYKFLQENQSTNIANASLVFVDFSEISYQQKAVLAVVYPTFWSLYKESKVAGFRPSNRIDELDIIKYIKKTSPLAVFFVNDISRLREILQSMSKT